MGKRELLLIVAFVIVGAVVYQATAPPPGPNDRSFSFSRLMEAARREIRGNRASAETVTTATQPLGPEVTEIRVVGALSELEITGEDRADMESQFRVVSNAFDDAEAKKYAAQTVLKSDRAAFGLTLSVKYPEGRHTGRQRGILVLKVPSRLRVRVESRPGKLLISDVSAVEATNAGGTTTIRKIAGRVNVVHRGGKITIEDAATLKFTGRSTEATVTGVRGDASFSLDNGGELKASKLAGPLDVEARNAEVTLENLDRTRGPIRVNATNGLVRLTGIKTDTRVDGRNTEMDITMAGAAPIAIYNDGEDVVLTPPPGGYRLDAVVVDGRIAPETSAQKLGLEYSQTEQPSEARASGAVNGGGPTITVRATRGNLTLRERVNDTLEK
jgi:hypothetical protein